MRTDLLRRTATEPASSPDPQPIAAGKQTAVQRLAAPSGASEAASPSCETPARAPVWEPNGELMAAFGLGAAPVQRKGAGAGDPASVQADRIQVKAWDLKRSARYGSDHYNERSLKIRSATYLTTEAITHRAV